jgi:cobalt/nickel transport system permease protein
MHIPDGYLGPLTYIPMYIIMIPIWLYAGTWLRKSLKTKQVPYLALAAAFSFVIMMFNVPIPGGSTGHAVRSGLVAIVLGPWAAVVTTSVALLIQCLLFGDGGVTALGANCFNMAVVIPFVAYYTYRLISGKTEIAANRRIIGAGVGGWLGLTAAAGVAGFQMGIQPLLEHTADGTPLYMPYGLSITVPAMLFGHAFFFSIVEAVVTALAFGYIARNDPMIIFDYKGKGEGVRKVVETAAAS